MFTCQAECELIIQAILVRNSDNLNFDKDNVTT